MMEALKKNGQIRSIEETKKLFYADLNIQIEGTKTSLKSLLPDKCAENISEKDEACTIDSSNVDDVEEILEILKSNDIEASVIRNANLLCVAHLPLNFNDEDFESLLSEYGQIKRSFLMIDGEGKSKGYGFVEFDLDKTGVHQARSVIDGKKVGSCVFHCDYLEKTSKLFDSLNSNCIYVDHLPPNYINGGHLREIFSKVNTPNYFQLGMKNGQSLGFAVVEYTKCSEAEETLQLLTNFKIDSNILRISYCIPGKKAINIYNHFVQNIGKHLGLLPSPHQYQKILSNSVPSSFGGNSQIDILKPIHKVLKECPKVFTSLREILDQLYFVQNKELTGKPGLLGIAPNVNPLMSLPLQVALFSVTLTLQLQQMHPSLVDSFLIKKLLPSQQQDQRIALGGKDKPSLLGNPIIAQASAMLQNLSVFKKNGVNGLFNCLKGISANNEIVDSKTLNNLSELLSHVNESDIQIIDFDRSNDVNSASNNDINSFSVSANPVLSSHIEKLIWQQIQAFNESIIAPSLDGNALLPTPSMPPNMNNISQFKQNQNNNQDFLMNEKYLQNFPPLTGNKTSGGRAIVGNANRNDGSINSHSNIDNQYSWNINSVNSSKQESLLGAPPTAPLKSVYDRRINRQLPLNSQEKETFVEKPSILGKRSQQQISGNYNGYNSETNSDDGLSNQNYGWATSSNPEEYNPNKPPHHQIYKNHGQGYPNSMENASGWNSVVNAPHQPQSEAYAAYDNTRNPYIGNPYGWEASKNGSHNPLPYGMPPSDPYNVENQQQFWPYNQQMTPQGVVQNTQTQVAANNNHGPIGPPSNNDHFAVPYTPAKTRKTHLLPSPETSPEGVYVGQHSQGIGGHYAESYKRRKYTIDL